MRVNCHWAMTTNMKRLFPILRWPANFGYKMRFYRSSFLYKLIFSIPWCQLNYPECSSIYLDGQILQMSNVQDNFSFFYCDTCTYVIMSHVHGRYAHIHHLSVQTHVLHNMVASVFNINGWKHVHNAQYGHLIARMDRTITQILSTQIWIVTLINYRLGPDVLIQSSIPSTAMP